MGLSIGKSDLVKLRITQHKRFARQRRTHPNPDFAGTSFMLGPSGERRK